MSDGNDKVQPRRFEPPPWEAEQFEELRRRRQEAEEREAALAITAAEATAAVRAAEEAAPGGAPPAVTVAAEPEESLAEETVAAAKVKGEDLDPRVVDAMLVQLQGQDPSALKPLMGAGRKAAYVMVAVTILLVVFLIVSLYLFRQSESAAIFGFGAAMLGVLALFCGGTAWWLWNTAK